MSKTPSPLITAENILDQWLTINKFFDQAEKLRLTLIKNGAATDDDAAKLLRTQISMYSEQLLLKLKDQQQMQAALDEASSAAAKSNPADPGKSAEAHN